MNENDDVILDDINNNINNNIIEQEKNNISFISF